MTISSNLASGARRALRAAAHHLDPVVMIGEKGLTASVLHEIDIALTAHALIKVRVASDEREQRVAFMNEICEKLGCESVQHLGKLLVLWRNREDGSGVEDFVDESPAPAATESARGPRKKLPEGAIRRTSERDPRPREGAYAPRPREGAYSARKPNGGDGYAARGSARGSDRGTGYAPRSGGFSRDGNSGYKPRGDGDGFSQSRSRESGFARTDDTGAGNRRYRRADEAPAPDTRPPREGWAPRGRRGAGRNDTRETNSGFSRGRTRSESSGEGFASGETRRAPAPRGRGAGGGGGGAAGGYGESRAPRTGRAPSGEGRWGSRGGSAGTAAAGAPKPRARRRLG
jgi:RNA-binding protein